MSERIEPSWLERAARLLMTLDDWQGAYGSPAEAMAVGTEDVLRLARALASAYAEGLVEAAARLQDLREAS